MTGPTQLTLPIAVELVSFMQRLDAVDGKQYYLYAELVDEKNTVVVIPVDGHGESRFFCLKHRVAYRIQEACTECANAVRENGSEASVTTCDTPENKPN